LPPTPIRATLPRMDVRTLAILDGTASRLDELIHVCRRLGIVYAHDPALAADVTRKAKSLRTSLQALREALDDPHHQPGKPDPETQPAPISTRLYIDPCLTEQARTVGYEGLPLRRRDPTLKALAEKYGKERAWQAMKDLTEMDQDNRTVLRLEARKACFGLLGPAPEHPLADFIRHGPSEVMGEEVAHRWQEEFRRRQQEKAATAAEAADEDQGEGHPKRKPRKGRSR
jgi:hypothetical protein